MNHAIVKLFLHLKFDTQSITQRAVTISIDTKSHNNDKNCSIVEFSLRVVHGWLLENFETRK